MCIRDSCKGIVLLNYVVILVQVDDPAAQQGNCDNTQRGDDGDGKKGQLGFYGTFFHVTSG